MRSEEEQVELIREWWTANGTRLLAGVLVAVVAVTGWRYWSSEREQKAVAASVIYDELLEALALAGPAAEGADDWAEVQILAQRILADYDGGPYAAPARLALARKAVAEGHHDEAIELLRAVAARADSVALVNTARLRLARVLVQTGQYQEALKELDRKYPPVWAADVAELRGDALRLSGQADAARAAYQQALEQDGAALAERIRMKLDDLTPAS